MHRIINQKHTLETLLYSLSRLFERGSYYGLRSLVVIYMTSEVLQMETSEAIMIYGWISGAYIFSQILGALLGDLLIGNKRIAIIGGIIQALGAFAFCIPTVTGLYAGFTLVILGTGLYSPNLISLFGKSYLNKTKLLDAGFTIFYLAINIGSFVGIILIGNFGEKSWNVGFIIAGVFMIISVLILLFTKQQDLPKPEIKTSMTVRVLKVLIVPTLVGLFWAAYEISNIPIYDLQMRLHDTLTLDIPKSMWITSNSYPALPLSLIFAFLWTYYYSSQFVKMIIGFLLAALSFGILFLIPENPAQNHVWIYILSVLLLGIAEIHLAPVVNSVLTKYVNPKYLAIAISLAFLPSRLFNVLIGLFNEKLVDNPNMSLAVGVSIMAIIGIGLLFYMILNSKNERNLTNTNQ